MSTPTPPFTVTFTIPELAGQFTVTTPKLYVWFAYFWTDRSTLETAQPVSVYLPPSSDTRGAYPEAPDTLAAVPIPPIFGTYQVSLDGDPGLVNAGVLAIVLGQRDTPADAISAGYAAFGTALSQQLNAQVKAHSVMAPTPDQIQTIAKSVQDAVKGAIKDKLGIVDEVLTGLGQEAQDEFIGYTYAFLAGKQWAPPEHTSLNLPPIENQIQYTFPAATLDVRLLTGPDPCQSQVAAVSQATASVNGLNNQLHALQLQSEAADHLQREGIEISIKKIRDTDLPAAEKALAAAQSALQRCRTLSSLHPPTDAGAETLHK